MGWAVSKENATPKENKSDFLKAIRLLIIDEISTIAARFIGLMSHTFHGKFINANEPIPFGGINIYLVGDWYKCQISLMTVIVGCSFRQPVPVHFGSHRVQEGQPNRMQSY
jgi:hypothetical protein